MFEEICLTCSKHLRDDGRAYCSDECENSDMYNSPSISSASSALSSPYIDYAPGGEVPALMPSALGTALSNNFQKRGRYSVSSSSTSSASWSLFTDAEEEGYASVGDVSLDSGVSGDGFARSAGFLHPCKSSGLSYTRQPSATNNHSTIPLLHRRTSSTSSSGFGQVHSSAEDDADSMSDLPRSFNEKLSEQERERHKLTVTSKSKKTRNRASLPAYFSLLQVSSAQRSSPPPSSSSGNTVNRVSPPTPKLASLLAVSGFRPALEATPRGRRREPDVSQSSRSNSRSRARQQTLVPGPRERQDSRSSVEQVFDWTCAPLPRGRPSVRRNSSPLPKMMSSMQQFDETPFVAGSISETHERRGRFKRNELGGPSSRDAPGYGNGRSGLRERERQRGVGASPL
ncbi:uncharacterized protein EDB91DRAFT_1212934 [Suillus paluster]|uniref:uncharacterized protein n=1 Tax=Suillus paluster TaxID=48578 RepID=UPI001B886B49|nr:uncharacterized protein EDB91DRAFT_1212934 [Suillus paluster]KAG1756410.1 hypothetical protein EDB91DRAFT_1212934 [Suillus paluster]